MAVSIALGRWHGMTSHCLGPSPSPEPAGGPDAQRVPPDRRGAQNSGLAAGCRREARAAEPLRTVYERMLGARPRAGSNHSGLPDMAAPEQLPSFTEVLDDVRQVALAQDSSDSLEVTPMLLLGARALAKHISRASSQPCWARA